MSEMKWKIAEPNEGLIVEVEDSGVWVRQLSGEIAEPHQRHVGPQLADEQRPVRAGVRATTSELRRGGALRRDVQCHDFIGDCH